MGLVLSRIVQVYEQNSIVNSVLVNDCAAKLAITACNVRKIEIFIYIPYTTGIRMSLLTRYSFTIRY